jgi:hypothetical protein
VSDYENKHVLYLRAPVCIKYNTYCTLCTYTALDPRVKARSRTRTENKHVLYLRAPVCIKYNTYCTLCTYTALDPRVKARSRTRTTCVCVWASIYVCACLRLLMYVGRPSGCVSVCVCVCVCVYLNADIGIVRRLCTFFFVRDLFFLFFL